MNDYGYRVARANGSDRFHLLPYGPFTTALCGKKDPRHNRHPLSSHANRARWVVYPEGSSARDTALCKKCCAEALKVIAQEKAERATEPHRGGDI